MARALLVGSLALVVIAFGSPSPVQAHPFGSPQTASITAGGRDGAVAVRWLPGAVDDYSYLAAGIGLVDRDRTQGRGGLLYAKQDADTLAASTQFERYMADHITATTSGRTCPARVTIGDHLVADGVLVELACPPRSEDVQIVVSMMTDLHPAYRTLATGPNGQRFVYTSTAMEHTWSMTPEVGGGGPSHQARSAATQLSVVVGTGGLLAALGFVLARRVGRRRVMV